MSALTGVGVGVVGQLDVDLLGGVGHTDANVHVRHPRTIGVDYIARHVGCGTTTILRSRCRPPRRQRGRPRAAHAGHDRPRARREPGRGTRRRDQASPHRRAGAQRRSGSSGWSTTCSSPRASSRRRPSVRRSTSTWPTPCGTPGGRPPSTAARPRPRSDRSRRPRSWSRSSTTPCRHGEPDRGRAWPAGTATAPSSTSRARVPRSPRATSRSCVSRSSAARRRCMTAPGLGLGLAIARTIARAEGGDVHAHARAGGGLVVRLELPLRVLIVDDEEDIRVLLRAQLELLPHLGTVRRRHLPGPVDAHRGVQPPPRPVADEHRQHHVRPAEHGELADLRPRQRVEEPARLRRAQRSGDAAAELPESGSVGAADPVLRLVHHHASPAPAQRVRRELPGPAALHRRGSGAGAGLRIDEVRGPDPARPAAAGIPEPSASTRWAAPSRPET